MVDDGAHFFETVLDAIDDLVLVKGPRSRLVWANRSFRELYGLDNDALRELIDGDQADPDDTLQYVRDDHRVFTTKARVDVPSEQITGADGSAAFFHTIKSPIMDGDDVVYQVGVSRPIVDPTWIEESEMQRSLAAGSFAALRSLVQALPSAVAMFDASVRFVAWSEAFAELVGTHQAGLLGAAYRDVLEERFPLINDLDRAMVGENVGRRIATIETGQPRPRSIEVECRPWFDHAGHIGGSVAILYDVTELLDDQARLRLANEELSQFTYRASHDLVAPVSTSQGLLELAAESLAEGDTDDAAHMITLAQNQLGALNTLIGELMDLARADASSTEHVEVDIADLVHRLTHLGELPTNSQPFQLELELEVTAIVIEQVRLQQILTNLLSNAMKFADRAEATRRLHIRSRRAVDQTIIEVSDNGLGIDPEDATSIFDIFQRGRTEERGHGLGLYIVAKHLRHLGGTIEITSLRKPTTFTITLPDQRKRPA